MGVPFSDPTAEGPVIQAANARALAAGTTTDKIFELVREIRRTVTVPMVFMTYANAVFAYGTERFASRAAEIGMDGLILPDVPFEEKADFAPVCEAAGLDLISLIAPTSHDRISAIARTAAAVVSKSGSPQVMNGINAFPCANASFMRLIRKAPPLYSGLPPRSPYPRAPTDSRR